MPQSVLKVNPAKQAQDEITVSVRQLLLDGAALGEVMAVLRETVFNPKHLIVIQKYDQWHVYEWIKGQSKQLHISPSLAVCVEFALKYEVKND